MLRVQGLVAFYGKSQVLRSVHLEVGDGEVVAVLGRNGAGKTTTLRSVMGLVRREGVLEYDGADLAHRQPHEIARLGIGYVPEHRGIFTKLTVQQNLEIAARRDSPYPVSRVYEIFPRLGERSRHWGYQLSGGEQQMLAIARAMVTGPKLVLLDEPSQGLAPVILQDVVRVIGEMREAGIAVLIVEQNLDLCQRVAQRFYVLDSGSTVFEGKRDEFVGAEDVKARYLTLQVARRPRTPRRAAVRER